MEKSIGIMIPPEQKALISEFLSRYGCSVEPFISLIDNDMLKGARGVDRNLQAFCLAQPSFNTIIGGPNIEKTDSGQLFYLTVMMGGLNTVRDKLIKRLRLTQDGGVFRPNILLIQRTTYNDLDFNRILAEAKTVFSKPTTIAVGALAIYSRDSGYAPFSIDVSYNFTGR